MALSAKPSLNWLFAFIPISVVLERAHVAPPLLFFSAALAIIPIARLIVVSTEQLATRTGDAVGSLLNATFGNAGADHRARRAAGGLLRHGARVDHRRHPREPHARDGRRVLPRRPAFSHPGIQSRRRTPLQLDDADVGHQPRRAERVQPLLLALGDDARREARERRHGGGPPRGLRAVSRLSPQDASRLLSERHRRRARTRARGRRRGASAGRWAAWSPHRCSPPT